MGKKTGPVLVIVDMQPSFTAARDKKTIKNCAREILNAIRLGHHIVFLEYEGERPTHDALINLCVKANYCRFTRVGKYEDDGSAAVFSLLKDELSYSKAKPKFTVCGVNTDACVKRTVAGLAKRAKMVYVVRDACNQPKSFTGTKDAPFEKMKKRKNVRII